MASAYPVLPSRPILPHISTTCSNSRCNVPLEFPVPSPQPRPGTLLQVRCFACQNILSHAFYPGQIPSSSMVYNGNGNNTKPSSSTSSQKPSGSSGQPQRKGRKIGTQDRPLETGYYDILGVPVTATTDDIKKAYRMPKSIRLRPCFILTKFATRPPRNQASSRQEPGRSRCGVAFQGYCHCISDTV